MTSKSFKCGSVMRSAKLLVLKHGLVCVSRVMFDMQTGLVQILFKQDNTYTSASRVIYVLTRVRDKQTYTAHFKNDNLALSISILNS